MTLREANLIERAKRRAKRKIKSAPAMRSNPPSIDPSGRYNTSCAGLYAVKSHNKYVTGGKTRGKVIPSTAYNPRPKAPSARDRHRMEVAQRRNA